MPIESGVYKLLTDDAAVAGLVGTRVYPEELPEGCKWPAILFEFVETLRNPTMDTPGVPQTKLRITCYAENIADAAALGEAVLNVLPEFSGMAGDTKILAVWTAEDRNSWDYEKSSAGLYYRELVFEMFYRA
jgi:Protein of unknown function (DUF3168)